MRYQRWLLLLLVLMLALLAQTRQLAEEPQRSAASQTSQKSAADPSAAEAAKSLHPNDAISVDRASTQSQTANADRSTSAVASAAPLSPSQARALMLARSRELDCIYAHRGLSGARAKTQWPWLPPERVALERAALEQAAARLREGCADPGVDEARKRSIERAAELQAARLAGDLYARLEFYPRGRITPEIRAAARQTLYDAVLSGDPEAIARIPRLAGVAQPPSSFFDAEQMHGTYFLWPLVACDLGMDCGPGSRALDRVCLTDSRGCGYAHLADFHRDNLPAWQYRLLEIRRREIVERIRTGNVAGLFEPYPVDGGGK